jgi:hypothetical protein
MTMETSARTDRSGARHEGDGGAPARRAPLRALPAAAALPRAFRRTPDLARDMAECLLTAQRRGARLTADDAYWLTVLRRRAFRAG